MRLLDAHALDGELLLQIEGNPIEMFAAKAAVAKALTCKGLRHNRQATQVNVRDLVQHEPAADTQKDVGLPAGGFRTGQPSKSRILDEFAK